MWLRENSRKHRVARVALALYCVFLFSPVHIAISQSVTSDELARTVAELRSRMNDLERRLAQAERESAAVPFMRESAASMQAQIIRSDERHDKLMWGLLAALGVGALNAVGWLMKGRNIGGKDGG